MRLLQTLDGALGGRRAAARLSGVIGADETSGPKSLGFLHAAAASAPIDVPDGVSTVLGAGGGLLAGMKLGHPVLGTIGGASLGRNLPALFRKELRPMAARNLTVTGVAIAGSLLVPAHRTIAFGVGYLLASIVTYYGGWR